MSPDGSTTGPLGSVEHVQRVLGHFLRLLGQAHVEGRLTATGLTRRIFDDTSGRFEGSQSCPTDVWRKAINQASDYKLNTWPLHRALTLSLACSGGGQCRQVTIDHRNVGFGVVFELVADVAVSPP